MGNRILVLGGTGTLGIPVVQCLAARGHTVRVLARSAVKARRMFGTVAEVVEKTSVDRDAVRKAMAGCDAVHISLPHETELTAVEHVTELTAVEHVTELAASDHLAETLMFPPPASVRRTSGLRSSL